jgi:aspartokinase/homoserine dehydrogenase 1
MTVLKFGGSSVADSERLDKVVNIIKSHASNDRVVVVVSAFGNTTNLLTTALHLASLQDQEYLVALKEVFTKIDSIASTLKLSEATASGITKYKVELSKMLEGVFLTREAGPRITDKILGSGELFSSLLLTDKLNNSGSKAIWENSYNFIKVRNENGEKKVMQKSSYLLMQRLKEPENIIVLPGFIASTENGVPTTLGRGGSDFSAALFSAGLEAKELYIYTDVSGIYTADPRLVKQARPVEKLSYREALELSHFGAKVLYAPSVQPAFDKLIPIYIKNTFEPEAAGTLIQDLPTDKNTTTVSGITHLESISLITVEGAGMIGRFGFAKRFFEAIGNERINIILITQASSEYSLCVAVATEDAHQAKAVIDREFALEIETRRIQPVSVVSDLSIVALVGEQMKSHTGVSGKLFSSLGANNINIVAIAQGSSERNISFVIEQKNVKKALNTIHERFFERQRKQINLFVVGVGTVGSRLLNILNSQKEHLLQKLSIDLRVVGISNSRTMSFLQSGHDLADWKKPLETGKSANIESFISTIKDLNLRNSIFIDNTANDIVASSYHQLLSQGIGVVTCNKIACSSDLNNYKKLQKESIRGQVPFFYETNVGAGLPIIDTLKNLIDSGDSVNSITAVLSGSLNFIFDSYNGTESFDSIVRKAMSGGYTEPDPRIDLSGLDVKRKLLILARESGYPLEIEDIKTTPFLPEKAAKSTSIDDFLEALKANESHFQSLFQQANSNGKKLKFVAELLKDETGELITKVGLKAVAPDSDYYNLSGSDNILILYTDRYRSQPLVIKGAGAGADVTASGLFGDIIRASNQR